MSSAQEAHFACEKCALAIHLEGRSLKLAGSNAAVGTALITCCVRATCERLQRRDGGGGTRVGRCGEGDSGSTMEKIVPPPRDEMTASSRRRRWCHRQRAATTALQYALQVPASASGETPPAAICALSKKSTIYKLIAHLWRTPHFYLKAEVRCSVWGLP